MKTAALFLLFLACPLWAQQDTIFVEYPDTAVIALMPEVRKFLVQDYLAWKDGDMAHSNECLFGEVWLDPKLGMNVLKINRITISQDLNECFPYRLVGGIVFIDLKKFNATTRLLQLAACVQIDGNPLFRAFGFMVGVQQKLQFQKWVKTELIIGCVKTKDEPQEQAASGPESLENGSGRPNSL